MQGNYLWQKVILYRGGGDTPTSFGTGGRRYSTDSLTSLQRHGRLLWPRRLTTQWPSLMTTPAYNKEDNLPARTGWQHHGWFICLSRLWCCGHFLRSVSCGLVYVNTPGHIFLDELFIEYEQVTTWESRSLFQQIGGKSSYIINHRLHWMAQWIGAQVTRTRVWLTSNSQLEGTIGRVADTVHAESFITRRNHLNLLWIITSLTYQVKFIQYILYYKRAITLVGKIVPCRIQTGLYHG